MVGLQGFDRVAGMELDYSWTSPTLKTRNEKLTANDSQMRLAA
jgi:hypothetical protein